MKVSAWALAVLLLGAAASAAPAPSARADAELPAGRYAVPLKGLLCAVCARAIAAEWAKLPEVESVKLGYDSGPAVVTVRLGRTLTIASLRRALRRAEAVANLRARYELGDVAYIP
ncbi:MAG: hypothetical protein HKL90_08685 [Elusimicrobia bacterium]|nr:hypothetical protein [Elusimicrobiota bacterium]